METTREIFNAHNGNLIHKWDHYFEIYDMHFREFVGKEIILVEIGVSQGGSIDLWQKFFGSKLKYYGIDINPGCKQFERDNVKIFIGSQEDETFLENIKKEIPKVDILIDDGGHTMRQQIVTFEKMFDHIKNNGIYLCEDNHTSYWFNFGGGLKRKGTYIEYVKNLVDVVHLWYAGKNTFIKNHKLKNQIYAIHIYDSIVVMEKKDVAPPFDIKAGNYTVGYLDEDKLTLIGKVNLFFFNIKNRIRSLKHK